MNIRWDHHAEMEAAARALAPEFPQAVDFHDEARVLGHLAAGLPGGEALSACRLLNVHYVPQRRLWAVYEVGDATGRAAIVTVRFLPGESGERFAAAANAARDRAAVAHLPDWDAVAWVFPEDDGRPELEGLTDVAAITELVRPDAPSSAARWRVLAYRPRRRCTVRYDWPRAEPAVGKLEPGAAERHERLRALWERPDREFEMPQPLACDPAVDCRFEAWAGGQRIEDLSFEPAIALGVVARGLPALHMTPVPGLPEEGVAQVLDRLDLKVLRRLDAALDPDGAPFARFGARLQAAAEGLEAAPPRMLHGDLHTGNVLLREDGMTFIDLDSLASGEPAFDLALLGSRLFLLELMAGRDPGPVAAAIAGLPDAYAEAGGDRVPAKTFAWFAAALLVGRQAKTCVAHLAPRAHELARELLAAAERTLDAGRFEAGA